MLKTPKCTAPEPYLSAALWLIYQVALFIRNYANEIRPQQLSDLGDAIHNIPESLTEYGQFFDEQMIRDNYLAVYDRRWAQTPDKFSLLSTLDSGIEIVNGWQNDLK